MKTIPNLILLFLLPYFGFSQINSSVDFIFGIDYSYRYLNAINDNPQSLAFIENKEDKESPSLNWRAGFNYNKRISNRLSLKTGLRLSTISYKGEKITGLRWGSENDGMGGYQFDPTLPHEIQTIYEYWLVEIPVMGRMEFGNKKWSPFMEAGFAPSYYLTTNVKSKTDLGSESEFSNQSNFYKFQLAVVVSAGVNYDLSDQLQLFTQVAYRQFFTNAHLTFFKEHLYAYGIELGIRKRIN